MLHLQVNLAKVEAHQLSKPGYAEWKKHTAVSLDSLKLPSGFKGWSGRPGFKGYGIPNTARIHALLDVGFGKRLSTYKAAPGGGIEAMVKGYWADVSQSVGRFPFGCLGTFCRSSIKYSYELDCVLTGDDALGALGFSHQDVRDARNKIFGCRCPGFVWRSLQHAMHRDVHVPLLSEPTRTLVGPSRRAAEPAQDSISPPSETARPFIWKQCQSCTCSTGGEGA